MPLPVTALPSSSSVYPLLPLWFSVTDLFLLLVNLSDFSPLAWPFQELPSLFCCLYPPCPTSLSHSHCFDFHPTFSFWPSFVLSFFPTVDVAYPNLHGFTTFPTRCHLSHLSCIAFSFPSVPPHVLRSAPSFVLFLSLFSTEEIYPHNLKAYHLKECHDLPTLGNACRMSPSLFHLIIPVLVTVGTQGSHLSPAEVHFLIYLKAHSDYGTTVHHD